MGNDLDNVWYSFFDEVGDSTSPTLIPIIGGKIKYGNHIIKTAKPI